MTNIVFPSEPYNKMKFESVRGSFTVKKMNVYRIGAPPGLPEGRRTDATGPHNNQLVINN